LKDDANLLGYFTDNELGWWDDALLSFFFKQPQSNATRQVLMRLLRRHYQEHFAQFQCAPASPCCCARRSPVIVAPNPCIGIGRCVCNHPPSEQSGMADEVI
jgi:hypothetical protein